MKNWLRKHYHWIIAVTALLQYTVTGGIANNLTSLFVLDVTADLEITRSAFSLAFMMKSMTAFLASLVIGLLLRRFGYRKLAVAGLAALGIGYVLLGAPVVTVLVPLLTTELFGNQAGDLSVSLMLAMVSFSSMLTSPIMNAIHDVAGSYIPGLRAASILALLTLGLYLLLFFLASRDRKKWEAQEKV